MDPTWRPAPAGAAPPGAGADPTWQAQAPQQQMSAMQQFAAANEIDPATVDDLGVLATFDRVVFVLDDSGSMATKVCPPGVTQYSPGYAACPTRWQELQNDVSMCMNAVFAVAPGRGVDVFFLNRPGGTNVMSAAQLAPMFMNNPSGGTPLVGKMRDVMAFCGRTYPGRVLVVCITDGEPSDGSPDDLFNVLAARPRNIFVTIAECNDNVSTPPAGTAPLRWRGAGGPCVTRRLHCSLPPRTHTHVTLCPPVTIPSSAGRRDGLHGRVGHPSRGVRQHG